MSLGERPTSGALAGVVAASSLDHTINTPVLSCFVSFISLKAGGLLAETQLPDLSLVSHHPLSQVLVDFFLMQLQFLEVVVLQALMLGELSPLEFFAADLALDQHLRADALDMLS